MINTMKLSRALTERFGLEVIVKAYQEEDGLKVIIYPCGVERTLSFKVELRLGWRSIEALFIPGNFAIDLVKGMRSANSSQKAAFATFLKSLKSKGANVSIELDHRRVDASDIDSWPDEWTGIQISMRKIGVLVEKTKGYDFSAVFPWATGFFGLTLALLPLEEVNISSDNGEYEGAAILKLVKQYERSRLNRAACIEIHGTDCKICGFNFYHYYGYLGDGFIHIHHIVPVSEIGGRYIIDPENDLMPVCPNCHSMLHRRKPALMPKELICILKENDNG